MYTKWIDRNWWQTLLNGRTCKSFSVSQSHINRVFSFAFFPAVNFIWNIRNDERSMFSRRARWAFAISSRHLFIHNNTCYVCSLLFIVISLFDFAVQVRVCYSICFCWSFVFLFRTTCTDAKNTLLESKYRHEYRRAHEICFEWNIDWILSISLFRSLCRFIHTYWLKTAYVQRTYRNWVINRSIIDVDFDSCVPELCIDKVRLARHFNTPHTKHNKKWKRKTSLDNVNRCLF